MGEQIGEETKLLPCEISRMVYGYLGPRTREVFLTENPDLMEISRLVEKKIMRTIHFETKLEDILEEYFKVQAEIDHLFAILMKKRPALIEWKCSGMLCKLKIISKQVSLANTTNNHPLLGQRYRTRHGIQKSKEQTREEINAANLEAQRALKSQERLLPRSSSELSKTLSKKEVSTESDKSPGSAMSSFPSKVNEKTVEPPQSVLQTRERVSPMKSRKNLLKSRVPTRCVANSMPTLEMDDVRKKIEAFTQRTNDDVINDVVAEPLANLFANTNKVDQAVENFLSNPDLVSNFTQVLDEVWDTDYTKKGASSEFCLSTPPHQSSTSFIQEIQPDQTEEESNERPTEPKNSPQSEDVLAPKRSFTESQSPPVMLPESDAQNTVTAELNGSNIQLLSSPKASNSSQKQQDSTVNNEKQFSLTSGKSDLSCSDWNVDPNSQMSVVQVENLVLNGTNNLECNTDGQVGVTLLSSPLDLGMINSNLTLLFDENGHFIAAQNNTESNSLQVVTQDVLSSNDEKQNLAENNNFTSSRENESLEDEPSNFFTVQKKQTLLNSDGSVSVACLSDGATQKYGEHKQKLQTVKNLSEQVKNSSGDAVVGLSDHRNELTSTRGWRMKRQQVVSNLSELVEHQNASTPKRGERKQKKQKVSNLSELVQNEQSSTNPIGFVSLASLNNLVNESNLLLGKQDRQIVPNVSELVHNKQVPLNSQNSVRVTILKGDQNGSSPTLEKHEQNQQIVLKCNELEQSKQPLCNSIGNDTSNDHQNASSIITHKKHGQRREIMSSQLGPRMRQMSEGCELGQTLTNKPKPKSVSESSSQEHQTSAAFGLTPRTRLPSPNPGLTSSGFNYQLHPIKRSPPKIQEKVSISISPLNNSVPTTLITNVSQEERKQTNIAPRSRSPMKFMPLMSALMVPQAPNNSLASKSKTDLSKKRSSKFISSAKSESDKNPNPPRRKSRRLRESQKIDSETEAVEQSALKQMNRNNVSLLVKKVTQEQINGDHSSLLVEQMNREESTQQVTNEDIILDDTSQIVEQRNRVKAAQLFQQTGNEQLNGVGSFNSIVQPIVDEEHCLGKATNQISSEECQCQGTEAEVAQTNVTINEQYSDKDMVSIEGHPRSKFGSENVLSSFRVGLHALSRSDVESDNSLSSLILNPPKSNQVELVAELIHLQDIRNSSQDEPLNLIQHAQGDFLRKSGIPELTSKHSNYKLSSYSVANLGSCAQPEKIHGSSSLASQDGNLPLCSTSLDPNISPGECRPVPEIFNSHPLPRRLSELSIPDLSLKFSNDLETNDTSQIEPTETSTLNTPPSQPLSRGGSSSYKTKFHFKKTSACENDNNDSFLMKPNRVNLTSPETNLKIVRSTLADLSKQKMPKYSDPTTDTLPKPVSANDPKPPISFENILSGIEASENLESFPTANDNTIKTSQNGHMEDSLITPSEVHISKQPNASASQTFFNTFNTQSNPSKTCSGEGHLYNSPIKAVMEAVHLATPSQVKHRYTPRKTGSGHSAQKVTPTKWYKVTNITGTPLQGLTEVVLKLPEPEVEQSSVIKDSFNSAKIDRPAEKECSKLTAERSCDNDLLNRFDSGVWDQTLTMKKPDNPTVDCTGLMVLSSLRPKFTSPSKNFNMGNRNFISPSKRVPRRATLCPVLDTRDRVKPGAFCSQWEAQHDVNNLDNYTARTKPENEEFSSDDERTTDDSTSKSNKDQNNILEILGTSIQKETLERNHEIVNHLTDRQRRPSSKNKNVFPIDNSDSATNVRRYPVGQKRRSSQSHGNEETATKGRRRKQESPSKKKRASGEADIESPFVGIRPSTKKFDPQLSKVCPSEKHAINSEWINSLDSSDDNAIMWKTPKTARNVLGVEPTKEETSRLGRKLWNPISDDKSKTTVEVHHEPNHDETKAFEITSRKDSNLISSTLAGEVCKIQSISSTEAKPKLVQSNSDNIKNPNPILNIDPSVHFTNKTRGLSMSKLQIYFEQEPFVTEENSE